MKKLKIIRRIIKIPILILLLPVALIFTLLPVVFSADLDDPEDIRDLKEWLLMIWW